MKKILLSLVVALATQADTTTDLATLPGAYVLGHESGRLDTAYSNLGLQEAIRIVKKENLEIKVADFDEQIKDFEAKIAVGYNYGKLDLVQMGMRSNDAGNVFGFKLQSREATFRDFGFADFLGGVGQALNMAGGDFGAFTAIMSDPSMQNRLLDTAPDDLNYPDARNHFQTKLSYQIPLYTGGKLTQYANITKALHQMSRLDKSKVVHAKIYQTKKSFYDISLLVSFKKNLTTILNNISRLEDMVEGMIAEGYAKHVDLLEVQSKKASVNRMLNQASANEELAYQFLSFLLNHDVRSIRTVYESAPLPALSDEEMIESNLDIKKAQKGLEVTEMAIELHKSGFLPELGAFAEYGSADDQFLNDFLDHDAYTVGFQFKWNLFSGMTDKNTYEKAKVENLKMRNRVQLAQKGIALQISKIKTEIKSYDFDIESLKKELEFADAVYDNYLGRYEEKLVSINDVIIKQSQQLEKVLKLQEVRNKRNERVFELEKIANGVSYE